MQPEFRIPEILLQQLKRLRDRMVSVTVAGGIGLTLLVVSLNIALVLFLDLLIDFPVIVRAILLVSVPITALGMLGWTVLRPLLARYQNNELAAVVEIAHPELRERLLSIVELQESLARGEDGGSELMRSLLLQQTVDFAKTNDFVDVVDASRAVRRCWMGGIAVFALLLPLVFATNAYAVLLSRFLNPWGNYERLQNLILTVDDADRVAGRGDDVTLVARPSWRFREAELPESVWLDWTTSSGIRQSRRLDWNEQEQFYAVLLPHVSESFDYDVSADQARTRRHHIEVIERPDILQFSVEMTPPAYTGQSATQHDALLNEILAIEQSRMELRLSFNKPLTRAEIIWLEAETTTPSRSELKQSRLKPIENVNGVPVREKTELPLSEDRQSAELSMVAALDGPSGRFLVRTVDEYGLQARVEPMRRLTIQPDRAPALEFADNEQHAAARPLDVLRIPLQATDDFGLATIELHYDVLRDGGKEPGKISVPADQLGGRSFASLINLDLQKLNLKQGMQVAIRARATDHRPVPAPNETWTGTRLIQIQDDARPYGDQTLADTQHRVDQAMDNLKADIEKQRQNARQLQTEAQTNEAQQKSWQGDEQTAALEEKLRELSQQMQKLSAVLDQQPVMQPLAEQARQIAERELAQAAAKADQARQAPLPQKQQKLSEAASKLQRAEEELKKIQEQHQKLSELQRDLLELNRLAENTEQLANQVDDLTQRQPEQHQPEQRQSEAAAEKKSPPTPQQELWNQDHQRLVDRHNQLEKDLNQILSEHPELLDKARENLQHQLASLGEQADRLAQQQQSLSNSTRDTAREIARQGGLRQKQEKLQQAERQLAEKLKLPGSDEIRVNGAKETRDARQALERGDFAESKGQHTAAAEQLQQLAQALQKNDSLPADPQQAIQELQQRQEALNAALAKLPTESTPESQAEMTRLAGEQAAIQRGVAELPQTNDTRDARQEALGRIQEAGRKLAENQQAPAQDQGRQAVEALQKVKDALAAALQDNAKKEAFQSEGVQKEIQKERTRSQEIQQQAADLVQRQQDLAQEIAAQTPLPSGRDFSAEMQTIENSPQPATPAESLPNGEASPEQATGAMQPGRIAAQSEEPSKNLQPENAPPENSQLAALPDVQQGVADLSRQLAEEARQLELNDDKINRASSELSNVTRAAAHELREANFKRAAELSQEAAEKAQQLSEALAAPDNQTVPERLQAAAKTAGQQQQALANQLQALAKSKEQQAVFRSQRQQQLQDQTQKLAQQLDNRADQLNLQQIDRKPQAETARQGEEQLSAANQQMQQALQSSQQGNQGQAAEAGQKSAEALRQAARLSRQASNGGNPRQAPEHAAQGAAGQHVAESAQFLNRAGEQLAKLGQPMRETQAQEQNPDDAQSQQGTPDEQGAPDQNSGQQPPESGGKQGSQQADIDAGAGDPGKSQASKSLRDAARNMRQAAQQMGLANQSQQSDQSEQTGPGRHSDQSTGTSPSDSASNGEAHLSELEKSLGKVSGRNWGKLPGTLQTELFESARRHRDAAYGGLIRRYFEDISKARPAQLEESTPQ